MRKTTVAVGVIACALILSAKVESGPVCVEPADEYSCWPMIQAAHGKLVCVYTRGKRHDPGERGRGTFARTSSDGGRTWGERITVASDPLLAQSPVGKGLDANGDALFWVRRFGREPMMALYRTKDGVSFELVAEPALDQGPMMQITDIFPVPTVGLMAFWFGGSYADDDRPRRWGTMTSADNGRTWTQRVCGENMKRADWPTEPSGFALDDGRIFAIARTEVDGRQLQLTSVDRGKTWRVARTNIRDVSRSTPSLVFDPSRGIVRNYYYLRGPGLLKCRTAALADVFNAPEAWPEPTTLLVDRGETYHAGNVNATHLDGVDYAAYYTGHDPKCSVQVLPCPHDGLSAQLPIRR